jgi:dihydrodipicolinate synthase/N-acetylneuraminate lyase
VQQNDPVLVSGVWAALLDPRDGAHTRALAERLQRSGVNGFVLNGATGECAAATEQSILVQIQAVKHAAAPFILGVGAANLTASRRLLDLGAQHGALAALAPVPFFFRYGAGEAVEFVHRLADSSPIPVLLYHLPQFTSGYPPEAVSALLSVARGIKDSSGSLALLRSLKEHNGAWNRILGHDGALVEAVREDLLHGVISGVAGVAPELTLAVWRRNPLANDLLAELLAQLDGLPTPWGLQWIAEVRGWFPASHAIPLSSARIAQKALFSTWCESWIKKVEHLLD